MRLKTRIKLLFPEIAHHVNKRMNSESLMESAQASLQYLIDDTPEFFAANPNAVAWLIRWKSDEHYPVLRVGNVLFNERAKGGKVNEIVKLDEPIVDEDGKVLKSTKENLLALYDRLLDSPMQARQRGYIYSHKRNHAKEGLRPRAMVVVTSQEVARVIPSYSGMRGTSPSLTMTKIPLPPLPVARLPERSALPTLQPESLHAA